MDAEPLLRVIGLHRRYGSLHAVRGLDFELRRGEVAGLLGVNGAGKTSTMRVLAGVLAPSAGRVVVDGFDLSVDARAARRRIGYLPDRPPLYDDMRVAEFLRFCARLRGVNDATAAMAAALERCGLEDVHTRLIGTLSRGYRQRVGIAQAILHQPALVILDEPAAGLDPVQNSALRALVRALGEDHAVLLSTHVLPEVQDSCTRVLMIAEGRLVLDRPLAALDARADGSRLTRLELRSPPADEQILTIDGVLGVAPRPGGGLLVRHVDAAVPERLAEAAVRDGWGLRTLAAETDSLERHFLRLACGPAPDEAAA